MNTKQMKQSYGQQKHSVVPVPVSCNRLLERHSYKMDSSLWQFRKISNLMTILLLLWLFLIMCNHSTTVVHCEGISAYWTRGYDNSRTFANLNEPILNTSNVNPQQFGKLFSRKVQGQVYAQILYVPNVRMKSDNKVHNVIYVATMSNNVYAFDAENVELKEPLWYRNFGKALPLFDNPVGQNCGTFADIEIEVGIVSTPVIDTQAQTIYFVTKIKNEETGEMRHELNAVDITSGESRSNSPVIISGQVPGNGSGTVDGIVHFRSSTQLQRMALSLIDGTVYIGFGGYCFTPPYHGWLFGYDARSLDRKFMFCATPNGLGGGIWQGSTGISHDGQHIYMSTANGDWDGQTEWSSSYLKLDPSKTVKDDTDGLKGHFTAENGGILDWFTPWNQKVLGEADLDVGATGVLLIPDSNLMMGCTKYGRCHVMNRDNLGRNQASSNAIVQDIKPNDKLPEAFGFGVHSSPVTWHSKTKGRLVYIWGAQDNLRALHTKMTNGRVTELDMAKSEVAKDQSYVPEFPGGMMSLSANGYNEGTGVLWSYQAETGNANHEIRPGLLRAFDANDINRELWNSAMVRDDDYPGLYAKWQVPMVANGRVYVGTFSHAPSKDCEVVVYGALTRKIPSPSPSPSSPPPSPPPRNSSKPIEESSKPQPTAEETVVQQSAARRMSFLLLNAIVLLVLTIVITRVFT